MRCDALVDASAAEFALPIELINPLKLEPAQARARSSSSPLKLEPAQARARSSSSPLKLEHLGAVNVYSADGGAHEYRVFGRCEVEVQGRTCHVRVIELPHGAQPLLGAVPLEAMDWHISPSEKRLLRNPKSPEGPLLPLC